MGREIRILCDKCGKDVYGGEYYTLPITRIKNGKQQKMPTIWLCRDCMVKANIIVANLQSEVESERL